MEALTFSKAMELYELLGAHIPEVGEDEADALEFIGKIVHNIRESEQHKDYVDAVMLMSDKEWEEVKTLTSDEVLDLFIDGLSMNKIITLTAFCDKEGFGHA
jgi:hypothetical protein